MRSVRIRKATLESRDAGRRGTWRADYWQSNPIESAMVPAANPGVTW